jgi:2-oxoglutarate dehydrogenase complex dihydrolipoamide succinyltransferase (E2) component
MPRIEVIMPQMGESIAEGTIVKWHKKVGEMVRKDETLLDISTDKVDSEIPSPASGILAEIVVKEQQTVAVQTVIAYLDTEGPASAATTSPDVAPPGVEQVASPSAGRKSSFYSPLVLSIARAESVSMQELENIEGTGEGGRVTKKDLLAYVEARRSGGATVSATVPEAAAPSAPSKDVVPETQDIAALKKKYPAPAYELIPMSNVLQKMAQHMVQSVQTSPHVAAVHEVDMTEVVRHRDEHAASFEKKEGFKLTFTPYIVDAVVRAIKKYPRINSSVEGSTIIRKTHINVGMAVASESGLLVPVIKHAEEKSFLGLARAVNDLALRTRAKKLSPEDIQGGTFTISNYGIFGSLIGTPIINQPQIAILGTGAIKKRVVAINDAIAIRSMAFFTLSFDHRVVDGALGGMFLEQVVKNLEGIDATMTLDQ